MHQSHCKMMSKICWWFWNLSRYIFLRIFSNTFTFCTFAWHCSHQFTHCKSQSIKKKACFWIIAPMSSSRNISRKMKANRNLITSKCVNDCFLLTFKNIYIYVQKLKWILNTSNCILNIYPYEIYTWFH